VRIAEAVLIPIYGEKKITAEEPFSAKLNEATCGLFLDICRANIIAEA
jgi:hypothetical protein